MRASPAVRPADLAAEPSALTNYPRPISLASVMSRVPGTRAAGASERPASTSSDTLDSAESVGWDHAKHGVTPPLERLCINPLLQRGFRNGRAVFGPARDLPTPAVRDWLALRLDALVRGIAYETCQLTPGALSRLGVDVCPITRERLVDAADAPSGRRWTRARLDAGYASGNLLMTSRRAADARERAVAAASASRRDGSLGTGHAEALAMARRAEACADEGTPPGDLDALAWQRAALLASYVQSLSHEEAAALPMRVLPPARLRLFNPVQAWQALLSRAWLHATPNRRLAELRGALPRSVLQGLHDAFVHAFHEAWQAEHQALAPSAPAAWAVEDAWGHPGVQQRWRALTRALSSEDCLAMVRRAGGREAQELPDALATDGWALERHGRLRPGSPALRLLAPAAAPWAAGVGAAAATPARRREDAAAKAPPSPVAEPSRPTAAWPGLGGQRSLFPRRAPLGDGA